MRYRSPIRSLELEVDLRWIDPERRSEGLLQMFGALARGEGLVLVEDRPWSVLPAMQAHHPGEFDWYPLEEGPPVWRVLVARRWTRISSLHRMLEFMSSDHRRMELMLIHIRDLAERGSWLEAARLAGYLEIGMKRHARMEERVVLPTLMARSPCEVSLAELKAEHSRMLLTLEQLRTMAVEGEEGATEADVRRLSRTLMRRFFDHERKEERLLYGPTDLLLGTDETGQLVHRCQEI